MKLFHLLTFLLFFFSWVDPSSAWHLQKRHLCACLGMGCRAVILLTVLSHVRCSLFWCIYFQFSWLFTCLSEITEGTKI